jgi:CxxC motif-containing protein (DUF1111 family)
MRKSVTLLFVIASAAYVSAFTQAGFQDPGVRGGVAAGGPLGGLTAGQLQAFQDGEDDFNTSHSVDGSQPDADATGLGPTFNLDNCGSCHAQPTIGGTSPSINPQVAMATKAGSSNTIPFFINLHGPVREARRVTGPTGKPDGGVLSIFTIGGRIDAQGCRLDQPDFEAERSKNNLSFRIPTPVFGDGLIESIPESAILANRDANQSQKNVLGIAGHENRSGQDGTITRFGWKAQVESLMMFSGQAYNVEMGITNELFPNERDQSRKCQLTNLPEDHPDFEGGISGVQNFTNFMRLVAPPIPATENASISQGRKQFDKIGCTLCHTPSFKTGSSDIDALANMQVNLYSDLLLHNMGSGLTDRIKQGEAAEAEFRTAPLWGLGQRIFFLHDGRTGDLVEAIRAHKSAGSEASGVINAFEQLSSSLKQDLLNFLRSL